MSYKIKERFSELAAQAAEIEMAQSIEYSIIDGRAEKQVDRHNLLGWVVKAKSLIGRICGEESHQFKRFSESEHSIYSTSLENLKRMNAIFLAVKEDFDGGHLNTMRALVQADMFDSELDQAEELLGAGYKTPAAVIAGTVLETALRELCALNNLPVAKLSKMNEDLAKAGVYNKLVSKQIVYLSDLRNKAAHGKNEEFTDADTKNMIAEVGRLVSQHLTQ